MTSRRNWRRVGRGASSLHDLRVQSMELIRPVSLDMPTSHSMARRGAMSVLGVGWQGLVRFTTNALVGRVGGPAVLGVVGSAISVTQLSTLAWSTSAGAAASKFVARARGAEDQVEAAAVAAHLARRTVAISALLALCASGLWLVISRGDFRGAASVAALSGGYAAYAFSRGLLFGAGLVFRATFWDLVTGFLGLGGVLVSVYVGVRGVEVLLPLAFAYALYGVLNFPWSARGRPASGLRRELDLFVFLGVVGTLSSAGFLQVSMLVARATAGVVGAGQYAAAMTLATPASMLAGSLSLVLFPALAEAWGRGDARAFVLLTDGATRVLTFAMIAVFGVLVIAGDLIVGALWGSGFSGTADLLPILLFSVLVGTLSVPSVNSITTKSQRGMLISTVSSFSGSLVGAIVWLVLAPVLGAKGVALGYLVGSVIIAGVPVFIVWRRDAHRWGALGLKVLGGFAAMLAFRYFERSLGGQFLTTAGLCLLFLALWTAVMRSEASNSYRSVRRKS